MPHKSGQDKLNEYKGITRASMASCSKRCKMPLRPTTACFSALTACFWYVETPGWGSPGKRMAATKNQYLHGKHVLAPYFNHLLTRQMKCLQGIAKDFFFLSD